MIQVTDLYEATRDGLDIILHYYPQAAEVVGTKNKFRCSIPLPMKFCCCDSLIHYRKEKPTGPGRWWGTDYGI